MQVSNGTKYFIYWKMVSFVYSKIQCYYLLDDIQNLSLKVPCQDWVGKFCIFDTDMLSLPKIAGGSQKSSFSHTLRNFKKIPEKMKIPTLGQIFLKSYACKLEKLQLDPKLVTEGLSKRTARFYLIMLKGSSK